LTLQIIMLQSKKMNEKNYSVDYKRSPGNYEFITKDGTPVLAMAFPDWDGFSKSLSSCHEDNSGYIISPELITMPSSLDEIRMNMDTINDRIREVQDLSKNVPNSLILLGTPTLDGNDELRNSLAVIKDGQINGYIDKRGAMWPDEEKEFSSNLREQSKLKSLGHTALICSDLVTAMAYGCEDETSRGDWIPSDAETLFVSSCWAIPQYNGINTPKSYEDRFKGGLEKVVSSIFSDYSNLKEVIMVDREAPKKLVDPYIAHFKRR